MGRGDNRLTKKVKQSRARKKKHEKLKAKMQKSGVNSGKS